MRSAIWISSLEIVSCALIAQACPHSFFQAKKTPVGDRGVRVIVVVANSVSARAPVVVDFCCCSSTGLIIVVYSSSSDPLLLASMCEINVLSTRISGVTETFFCAQLIKASLVPVFIGARQNNHLRKTDCMLQ